MNFRQIFETAAAVIASLGGGGLIVAGLSSWLGKFWAKRILEEDKANYARELEGLKAGFARTLFVSRTHFETEFKILRDIWQKVAAVRSSMSQLRPVSDIVDPNKTPEEILDARVQPFLAAVGGLMEAIDENTPFYSPEIFATLDQLLRVAQREREDIILSGDAVSMAGRKRGRASFEEYMAGAEKVSTLIRERLEKLSVQPQMGE